MPDATPLPIAENPRARSVPLAESPWKEECGVSGVFCTDGADAAPLVHIALYALQHRGQESAGIAALGNGELRLHRGMGLV
ncbi:MAG: hypothetical protein ACREUF_10200, partial [Solimonas sp.]